MTLTDLMPTRIGFLGRVSRRAPKHRAVDEIDRQRILRHGADLLIKGLRLQLDEQETRHADVVARIDERHGEIVRSLEGQIVDLERRLNIGVLAENVVTRTQELSLEEIRKHCVLPLHESPLAATDPGRVPPSWAREGDTVPVAAVRDQPAEGVA